MTKIAKLFNTGGSQAVRLPVEFRFDEDQVFIRRDERTGDVILSRRPRAQWSDFMTLRAQLGPLPDDFLRDRQQSAQDRDPFEDWHE
jgi:antitoxin VapB